MKIVVTNYTGDRGNWGCQATSRELLRFLQETVPDRDASSIITVPLPAPHAFDRHVESGYGGRLRRIYGDPRPSEEAIRFVETLTRERFGQACDDLAAADVVVFQGEGTVGPQSMFRSLRLFALPFLAVHRYRKPVLSMNQSLYAADAGDAALIRSLFGSFRMVAFREAASYCFARSIGLDHAVLCPDFAFRQAPVPPTRPLGIAGDYFCVSGSAASGAFDPKSLHRILRQTVEEHGLRPVFLSSRAKDTRELGALLGGLPGATIMSSTDLPDAAQLAGILAGASFVIGGRYHTAIAALTQGTPVLLFPGNTHKNEGLAAMLDLKLQVFGTGDEAAIMERIEAIICGRGPGREETRTAVSGLGAICLEFGQFVAATLREVCHGAGANIPPPAEITPIYRDMGVTSPHGAVYQRANRRRGGSLPLLHRIALRHLRGRNGLEQELQRTFVELP
jgi:polysaccharide pyruvyl transferase WcaK-like protein